MSTIAVEMGSKKPQADAELEELDVREVSIVDRPANKRKFLIVKRDAAGLDTSEEAMPNRVEVIKDEDSLLDLLGLGLDDADDSETEVVLDEEIDIEAITKAAVEATTKVVAAMVGRLSRVVSSLKSGGDAGGDDKGGDDAGDKEAKKAEVPAKTLTEIKGIAKTLGALADKLGGQTGGGDGKGGEAEADGEKEAAKKADTASVLKVCSAALQQLMSAAGKLKSIDKGAAEVPSAIVSDIGSVAVALAKAVTGGEAEAEGGDKDAKKDPTDTSDKKTTKKAEAPFQVFVTKGDDDDPEIIIKAGAKMKKARLNQFKKAVETLMSLLKELEGDQGGGDKDAKDKKGVKKSETGDLREQLVKGFELLETKLGEKVDAAVTAAMGTVTKRLDEIEETVPPSNGDADATETKPEEVTKKTTSMWSSVFAQ